MAGPETTKNDQSPVQMDRASYLGSICGKGNVAEDPFCVELDVQLKNSSPGDVIVMPEKKPPIPAYEMTS